jgi:hypothetical protein
MASLKELKILVKDENFNGSFVVIETSGFTTFDIYRAISKTQSGAQLSAFDEARNPIRSYQFVRKLDNGNIEMLLAVPKIASPTPTPTPTQINEETNQVSNVKKNIQSQVNTLKSLFK